MAQSDKVFSGPIAAIYDGFMGPIFFEPFARDLAKRIAALSPATILETAAGSGISTEAIVSALPAAKLTATDLNQAMIDVAKTKPVLAKVAWQACDATNLPFADASFDVVASQFGVMFFPDKLMAYRDTHRVLRRGGHFVFNVWDKLEANPAPSILLNTLAKIFPDDPPSFMRRVPHGYREASEIAQTLNAAGFSKVDAVTFQLPCQAASARHLAIALCQGTPTRPEIEQREPEGLNRVTAAVEAAFVNEFGQGEVKTTMQAIVFTATF